MGMEIEAGDAALYTRSEASLVTSWCAHFDTRTFTDAEARDRFGMVEIPAEIVRQTHAAVPFELEAAQAAGFEVGGPHLFAVARRFLEVAAADPEGITGSW